MTEQSQSMKARLLRLQNLLTSDSSTQPTLITLQQLLPYFAAPDLTDEGVARGQVYDELRDTVKAVFGYLQRVKNPLGQVGKAIEAQIKQLLLAICGFCSAFYYHYLPLGCGEMIRDFLSSQCRLFVLQTELVDPTTQWKWARSCSFKTSFFCSCVEMIMGRLAGMQSRFQQMRITVIGQYLRLLYYMDDYLLKDKVQKLVLGHVTALYRLFRNPTKETMRQVNKQAVEEVMDYLLRLMRNVRGEDELRRTVQLLGPNLAASMIKLPSIQKKIVGSKILNRFSYDMLYKTNSYLSEQYYAEWLLAQGFFQVVFEDHCQASIVKISDDSFKLLVKRGCIDKPKFQRFFQVLEKADAELRRYLFRLIDPFRINYDQIQTINQIFAVPRSVEFYDDQFFYFYQGISRYATQTQLRGMLTIVENILAKHYASFPTYLTRRRAVQCYAYIFEKLVICRELPQRLEAYQKVAEQFLQEPTESRLIMLKTLYNNLTQSKLPICQQEKLAVTIVDQMNFLTRSLPTANSPALKEDLLYYLRSLLTRYTTADERKGFVREDLVAAVECPEVFEEMLRALRAGEIKGLFEELAKLSSNKEFSFSCLRWTFIHLNRSCLRPIKKEYADVIATYATIDSPSRFKGVDLLLQLVSTSQRENLRRGACELLAEIATNFSCDFRVQGEAYLPGQLQAYNHVITEKVTAFLEGRASLPAVRGALELAEALMLSTEYFGVGQLRAHNSLVPASTVWLRVYNNCGLGDDTQKIFEKRFPSNRTLFEVIREVAVQFKVGPLDVALEFPNLDIIRYHGLTLEQLKLNGHELNAIKLAQSRSKAEAITVNGELTAKARVVFTEIFNRFAVGGYMGPKECANYVNGVTMTYCPLNDSRITDLFAKYDSDRDQKLTVDDFLRFYRDCVDDPHKMENVERNLYNLHYRNDLLPYDAEIPYEPRLLFRHYAATNLALYDGLFTLATHSDPSLARQAQTLLLRLPTSSAVVASLAHAFDLKGKNSFETQYLLTALQFHLTSKEEAGAGLIERGNHISIFEYLGELAGKEVRGDSDRNCLVICLHVLRSLLGCFSLREVPFQAPSLAFSLPHTNVFTTIIRESVVKGDSTLLQPALALQLTQEEISMTLVQEGAFSKDKDTRTLICNFLRIWLLTGKGAELNLFKVPISPTNNQQWFSLLAFVIRLRPSLDPDIFSDHLRTLSTSEESLEGERFNPLLFGSLTLIKEIYQRLSEKEKQQLNDCLTLLLPRLISNENRSLIYDLRLGYPQILIQDLERTVQVEMSHEGQLRNRFVGIKNLGCICYMNSILQQFFMIRQFYHLVLSLPASQQESTVNGVRLVDDFLAQLQQMYVSLEWSQKQYYDPTPFCLAIKDSQGKPINTHIQEDAHEFLNSAFDKMEGYCKKEGRVGELEGLFGGKTVTEIICQTCKNKNEVLEHFYHLSVEVKGMKSLKESFDKLIQIEQIQDYFCEDCGKKVEKITKQMLIKQAPQILIINLQRIIFDLQTFLKVKVHTRLQFDHTLDLHSYFSASAHPAPYTLKGVVIHAGTSEGGHYYSLIKHQDRWYKFNDQSVTPFSESDIGREAFGGEDVTDHWGEHTSSTNAYILFYQRTRESPQQPEVTNNICAPLVDKVMLENQKFMRQMQYNQPSFFNALHQVFLSNPLPNNRQSLKRIGNIYRKALNHFTINSDLKTQLVNQVRDDLLAILSLLEELAVQVLEEFKEESYRQAILNFTDVNIRDIYAKVLAKAIKVAHRLPQYHSLAKSIFHYLLSWLSHESLLKNLHKSYQYFEMLKDLLESVSELREEAQKGDFLVQLLDFLMGKESVLAPKDKKRMQLHTSQAIPVVQIINYLISCKLAGKRPFSEDENRVLKQANFYRRAIKNKMDSGLLAPIISAMARDNIDYSKMIAQVLLRLLNSNDEVEDKSLVLSNITAFLMIDDSLQEERFKWVLGIPQLQCISLTKQEFGLSTSAQSLVFTYVSSLFFIKDSKYQPLLFTLFEKRKYFSSFSAYGVLALLQLVIDCQPAFEYILSLPAPTYVRKSYFGWISNYAMRIKNEEHYGLPMQKGILYDKINGLLDKVKEKAESKYADLPVNKYIIGKNVQLTLTETLALPLVRVDMYTHLTYVLPNLPEGNGNISLPEDEFSFASTKEPHTAKFFLQGTDIDFQEEVPIEKRLSMITFQIHTQASCCLSFNIPSFRHRIYLRTGMHSINAPYHQGALEELVSVEVSEQVQLNGKKEEEMVVESLPPIMTSLIDTAPAAPSNDFFMQIQCKHCTYINFGREKCEVCDGDLF